MIRVTGLLIVVSLLLAREGPPPDDIQAQVAGLVAGKNFNFVSWTLDSLARKVAQNASAEQNYLPTGTRRQIVLDYFALLEQALRIEGDIDQIFADPSVTDPNAATAAMSAELRALRAQMDSLQPLAEAVLQEQIALVLSEAGFGPLGQLVPPVSFHITALPQLLVVSPRDRIELIASASLNTGLAPQDEALLEERVDATLDVSSLVVPLGGLGTYPTMIYETTNLDYVSEVGAHEWTHNYLTLRPLGINYLGASPEVRTMNETTANIVGREIGSRVIARFYPERRPPATPTPGPSATPAPTPTPDPDAFDFRAEMRETRVRVDELLAEGQIAAAEAYMARRREVFVAHGYHIRKLNQAYFAFHGAYADAPGAAGADPVGPAVVELWERIGDLKDFLESMAWMTSFDDLQQTLAELDQATRHGPG